MLERRSFIVFIVTDDREFRGLANPAAFVHIFRGYTEPDDRSRFQYYYSPGTSFSLRTVSRYIRSVESRKWRYREKRVADTSRTTT